MSAAFAAASAFFCSCAEQVAPDAWSAPGLGEWTLRGLVAHGNRAHTTVEDYLLRPVEPVGPDSPYFSATAIAERGREAERALGDDPAAAVAATSARVTALVAQTSDDAVLGTPGGPVTLADYLPSRVAELVIHGLDVARAVGVVGGNGGGDVEPPEAALREALRFLAERSVGRGTAIEVIDGLTGRAGLPPGFSVC